MKTFVLLAAILMAILILTSCSAETVNNPPQEFIAAEADFAGYTSWEATTAPRKGPDPAGQLGGAHGEPDTNVTRSIWVKQAGAKRASNGQFDVGTIFLKEMKGSDGTIGAITAMAKRGNNYDASGNDWEYFLLDGAGTIQDRGSGLMGGLCKGCHGQPGVTDYVFTR
jgi:hypothetical protein